MRYGVIIVQCNNHLYVANQGLDLLEWNKVLKIIDKELTFDKKIIEYQYNKTNIRIMPVKMYKKNQVILDQHNAVINPIADSICCPAGFKTKIINILKDKNISYYFKPDKTNKNLSIVDWNSVSKKFDFYPKQRECLETIAKSDCGVIYAVTGFGKMVLLAMTTILYPNAIIDVVVRSRGLAEKIHEFLLKYHSKYEVGLIYSGSKKVARITVFTGASLPKGRQDTADILLCDEAHELITDFSSQYINNYKIARRFAFTATPKGRLDNADLRMEAFFGPIIFELKYQDAVDLGLVVPIKVIWNIVEIENANYSSMSGIKKERFGIWRNEERNKIIAQIANSYPDDTQVQILVKTVEHGLFLKQLLPNFTLIFDSVSKSNRKKFARLGLANEDELEIPLEQQHQMRRDFENNKLKKVITTKIWATGIDARNLSVLIRADASASEILAIQASGRLSRKSTDPKLIKEFGIVHDFMDKFDNTFYRRSFCRRSYYDSMGWEQVVAERNQNDSTSISN